MGLPIFQIRVLGLLSRVSVWAAMEGYGRDTDPIVLLGWRVILGPFLYPHHYLSFILEKNYLKKMYYELVLLAQNY